MCNGQIDEEHHECPEEHSLQSSSPFGVVVNDEKLGRFIYRDDWVDDYGNLTPAAIPIDELRLPERKGVSVARLDKMSENEISDKLEEHRSKTESNTSWVACTQAENIRNLRTGQNNRLFCVIDDAVPDFLAHALVRLHKNGGLKRQVARRYRKCLLELFDRNRLPI